MFDWETVKEICLLAFLAAAAFWDIGGRRIPNWLNVSGAAVGLAFALFLSAPEYRPWWGLGIGFGVFLLLYLLKGVGGGDVKMMVGVGLLAGYPDIVYYLFYSSLAAVVLMLAPRIWKGELLLSLKGAFRSKPGNGGEGTEPAPVTGSFALAMLVGVVWVWVMRVA